MRGYVSGVNRVSKEGSENFDPGLCFEIGPKFCVDLKFHMGQKVHALS